MRNGMRRGGIVIALLLVAFGVAAMLAFPRSPALLAQRRFFLKMTDDIVPGRDVVQTFRASGSASGITVVFATWDHTRDAPPLRCTLFEVVEGSAPADWRERTLAVASASKELLPPQAPLAFAFPAPVPLRQGALYGVRIESGFPEDRFWLMRDDKRDDSTPALYQGGKTLPGALAFTVDGAGGPSGVYRVLRSPVSRMTAGAAIASMLLLGLLVAGALFIVAVPGPRLPVALDEAAGDGEADESR